MPLDPVIARGFRGLQLQDPLEQYGRISQIQQAQQQNQLAALKMQEYQRGVETQNRLRSLDPSAANYMTEVMRLDPELGSQLMLRSKQQTAAERAAAASEAEGRAKNLSYWQGLARDSARTPTDDVVAGLARRAVELGVTDEGTASSQLQQLLAMPPEQRTQVLAQYGASAAAPPAAPATPADVATMQALGFPLTQQGYEQFRAAQRQPQPSRLADRLVPVGKLVFDRETRQFITPPAAAIAATQERGAAAPAPAKEPAAKPLTAAQEATRRDKLGKEFKSASSALQTTQDVLDSIAAVKDSPGLSRATGFTGTMLPSFPEGQAAQAETRLANLKGKITALGKAQAAATGAIGSIANQEWKILSDQIAAIDPVKGAGPLLEQIGLVEAQALGAMERMRDEYSRQFGEDFERFPQFKDLPPPKSTQPKGRKSGGAVTPAGAAPAPATGALSPAEQAELEQLRNRFRKGG
jgi:hypothetical protein